MYQYQENNVIQEGNGVAQYITKVFMWMFAGFLITALSAWAVIATGTWQIFLTNRVLMILFVIAEFALVIYISTRVRKNAISTTGAKVGFIAYSIINGITLSAILLVYDVALIYKAFFVAAITFGVMAIYGHVTRKDLTNFGRILFMALLGVIIATVVNMIFGIFGMASSSFDLVLSYITVIIFLGLTAWDTQKIKAFYYASEGNEILAGNAAIVGALALYLDFINIILSLLRIFGASRD